LKIWITPLASVAMLEKLALLKIALCRAPILTSDSSDWNSARAFGLVRAGDRSVFKVEIGCPNSGAGARRAYAKGSAEQ
jgi:hypothetical protein